MVLSQLDEFLLGMVMQSTVRFPQYARIAFVLLTLVLIFYIIHLGQNILLPLGFSLLFAVLLRQPEAFFIRKGLGKIPAILTVLILFIIMLWIVVYIISGQVSSLADELPQIKKSLLGEWQHIQVWLSQKFNISFAKQDQMIQNAKDNTLNNLAPGTFNLLTASIATMILIPVYIFLFLFYRDHFVFFLTELFKNENKERVIQCIGEVKTVVHHFILGVLTETSIVAGLNVAGLLIIGAPYAVLLGIVGAIMNTIPWIGGIIQLILSALIVFADTGSTGKLLATLGVLLAVQMIDNYFLVPRIIGSRVSLNALISIVAVLIGGAVAGVGGMFLSIPFLAMIKVIFSQSEPLKPWAILLGGDSADKNLKKTKR